AWMPRRSPRRWPPSLTAASVPRPPAHAAACTTRSNRPMMMALGLFVFSLETLAYQDFQRQTAWVHGKTSRVGANPARQFQGRDDDTITLSGVLLPGLAGTVLSLDALRAMGDTGKAWPLIEGTGKIYGVW